MALTALLAATTARATGSDPVEPLSHVDPFIGTGGHGHTYPGATVPFGMVQLSPDTRLEGWDGCSGYHYSDDHVFGFSHTHLSGTGISDYGDILLFPSSGPIRWQSGWYAEGGYGSHFSKTTESASPGYYAVTLDDSGTRVELTATARAGMHRYTFPAGTEKPYVLLDLSHRDEALDSGLRVVNESEVEGFRISKAWAQDQRVYFVARFSRPIEQTLLPGRDAGVPSPFGAPLVGRGERTTEEDIASGSVGMGSAPALEFRHGDVPDSWQGTHIVVALRFGGDSPLGPDEPLMVKVGISPVSIENARENLNAEVPGWDFDAVHEAARSAWRGALSRIEIEGGTEDEQKVFYTALYHALLQPNLFTDVNGEYRGHDGRTHDIEEPVRGADHRGADKANTTSGTNRQSGAFQNAGFGTGSPPQYTVFSLWDTFRAAHPLYTILEPTRTEAFIASMLRQYEQSKLLPVWELAGNETMCMIGYHSVSVIADAYAKGIRGFDAEAAFAAMKSSAMQNHLGLAEYRQFGYIPGDRESESVSKTLEYAYDDWCIAQLARELGHEDDEREYLRRAQYWRNLLDPETGFMRPKSDSRWKTPFLPTDVDFHFTEANSWQYSFFVPQDVSGLIDALGGPEAFVARLDSLFSASSETTGRNQADITGLIGQYAHGNEPSHHMAYLYAFAGQPWKTQARVHEIMTTLYAATPDGLAGNEDCGQMSAWFVMSALGFYSVAPGQDSYVIGTPLFDRATIHMENGNSFTIVRDQDPVSGTGTGMGQGLGLGEVAGRNLVVNTQDTSGPAITLDSVRGSEPGISLDPVRAAEPGITLDPVRASEPGITLDPVRASEPGISLDPVRAAEPGITLDSVLASDPGITLDPVRAAEPGITVSQEDPKLTIGPSASFYIQSATLDGARLDRCYLRHGEITAGGVLRFVVGAEPNRTWGVGRGNAPVSEILAPECAPVPYVAEGTQTFRDSIYVALAVPPSDHPSAIYYTLDGTEPTIQSPSYSTPLRLEETTRVRFAAIREAELSSEENPAEPGNAIGHTTSSIAPDEPSRKPTGDSLQRHGDSQQPNDDSSQPGDGSLQRHGDSPQPTDRSSQPDWLVQEATFRRISGNRRVVSSTSPSPTYPGGSEEALIDGLRGGLDFRLGAWQGFEGQDMELVIDLVETIPIHHIALGCLQDENSWIFMPESVEFETSLDGISYLEAGTATSGVDPKARGAILREIEIVIDETPTRFIRVRANSLQVCPEWHKGAGNPCWIFLDELLAE